MSGAIHLTGRIFLAFAALHAIPFLLSLGSSAPAASTFFALNAGIVGFVGGGLLLTGQGISKHTSWNAIKMISYGLLFWFCLPAFSFMPFMLLSGIEAPSAYLESLSAFLTSGLVFDPLIEASIARDAIEIWRVFLGWCGGFSYIIAVMTLYYHLNPGSLQSWHDRLPANEGSILPTEVVNTFKDIFPIYTGLTFIGFILFLLNGEGTLKSALVAMASISTMGLGGEFGVMGSRIAEGILAILLFAGSLNIVFFWRLFHARRIRGSGFEEVRNFAVYCLACILAFYCLILPVLGPFEGGFFETIHLAFVGTASLVSTSGFTPAGWEFINNLPVVLLSALLLAVGGTIGSSTGGIKLMRGIIMLQHSSRELRRLAHPHAATVKQYAGFSLSGDDVARVWLLVFAGLLIVAFSTIILAAFRVPYLDAIVLSVAHFANAGQAAVMLDAGVHVTSMGAVEKSVLGLLMVLGRTEGVLMLALLTKGFWKP